MATPANLLTEWARILAESLADAGITDVVVSPGSRSTPFLMAAAGSARLRLHDVVDERAAAFFALGQARVTGRPSALLCTSGSAAAHYLPAAIEAGQAQHPMLLCTADRPFELQACGAAQTIDQIKLFGDQVRAFFETGMPDASPGALRAHRRVIAQAAHATLWPVPGAVHLNLRARKPLEPRAAVSESERQLEAEVARLLAAPIPRAAPPRLVPDPDAVRVIAGQVRSSRRGIIVCGPMPVSARGGRDALFTLARRTGYPLLVEAASQMRFGVPAGAGDGDRDGALVCDGFDSVLQSPRFRAGARPDLILQLGATPTSTGWSLFSDQHGEVPRVAIGGPGWGDPGGASTLHLIGEVEAALRALVGELAGGAVPADPAWRARFAAGNRAAWDSVRAALAERPGELAEGEVARQVVAALPPGSLLVLGNSLPIRLVDSFAAQQAGDAAVLVQRGANGIDGLVAGAAGAASVADGPVTLLLGDVSLLHDLTSLALARCARANLVVVVIHNGGGRIFEQLPIARSPEVAPEALGHLLTPHQTAFEPAARLFGLDHARPDSRESLGAALAAAHRSGRPTLIEAVVLPHGAAELHQQIWSATDQAVAALLAGTR